MDIKLHICLCILFNRGGQITNLGAMDKHFSSVLFVFNVMNIYSGAMHLDAVAMLPHLLHYTH